MTSGEQVHGRCPPKPSAAPRMSAAATAITAAYRCTSPFWKTRRMPASPARQPADPVHRAVDDRHVEPPPQRGGEVPERLHDEEVVQLVHPELVHRELVDAGQRPGEPPRHLAPGAGVHEPGEAGAAGRQAPGHEVRPARRRALVGQQAGGRREHLRGERLEPVGQLRRRPLERPGQQHAQHRAAGQDPERHGHDRRGLVGVLGGGRARLAQEGEDEQPGHVEGRAQRRPASRAPRPPGRPRARRRSGDSSAPPRMASFDQKPASGTDAGDGQGGDGERPGGVGHLLPQAAHLPDVGLVAHAVHDRAGAEEQAGLEEGVGGEVGDAGPEDARAHPDEHEAELAHGGVGQHLLDVGLGEGDDGGEERGERRPRS